jgi:hypothetical protein
VFGSKNYNTTSVTGLRIVSPLSLSHLPHSFCYRITCICDRVVMNFLFHCITLFTYGLYLPLSVISSFGTPINIVNLAPIRIWTKFPSIFKTSPVISKFSQSSRALGRGPFYLPYWYALFPRLLSYMFLPFIVTSL